MTITAKYAGKCTVCKGHIAEGDEIEWSKGKGSKHAACAVGSAQPPARDSKPARPRARRSEPKAPRPDGPMLRNDRDPYVKGAVLVAQLSAAEIAECEARQAIAATEIPGDPCKRAGDRRVAVVVIHTDRMSQDDADDDGYCGRFGATVRLATADEAATILAERAAKAQAKADAEAKDRAWKTLRATLTAGRILVEDGEFDRTGAEVLHEERRGMHGTISERWARLSDGSIMVESHSHDDHRCGRYVTTDRLLEMARASTKTLEDAIRGQRYSAVDRAIVWLAAQAGKTPRPPVTVTLRGLDAPVTLSVRVGYAGRIVAEPLGGGTVRVPEGNSVRIAYEWTWSVDQLRSLLEAAPPSGAFGDIEFAPGAEIGGGDRVALPGGLWIEGMRAALAELEARA